MLYLRDISIGYGRKVVASGITAHLRRGWLTCLIGRNGSGKSTLLRTIAGLLPPLCGAMEFTSATTSIAAQGHATAKSTAAQGSGAAAQGHATAKSIAAQGHATAKSIAAQGHATAKSTSAQGHATAKSIASAHSSGIAAQGHATQVALVLPERIRVEHLTVYDLIATSRIPYTGFWGTLCAADRAAIERAMRLTATSVLSGRDVTTLSDGEYQKVMIARAVAQQTPLILLDEPTAFLDYESKHEAFAMLRRLCHDEGKTVLLSTHDVDVARKYADEVWEDLMKK